MPASKTVAFSQCVDNGDTDDAADGGGN